MPRTLHLVDPELRPLLETFPAFDLNAELLPALREMGELLPPLADASALVSMDAHTIPGPVGAPGVGVIVYRPLQASGALPCLLHIHGGGYVAGSAAASEPVCRPLAAEIGCVIVSVDYRLAPETRFPGNVEDCYAALAWVFAQAASLGIDAARVGVIGESAGGGLAAALALLARDRGQYRLQCQALTYPMLDDRTCVAEPHPYAGEFIWTAQSNVFGWSSLLGVAPGSEGVSAYAAPARAENLAGLPATYVATAALDLFVEEDVEYARRLLRAGVPTELHVFPGAYHGFDYFTNSAVALEARRSLQRFLQRALGSRPG